jgi:hypothetical protein
MASGKHVRDLLPLVRSLTAELISFDFLASWTDVQQDRSIQRSRFHIQSVWGRSPTKQLASITSPATAEKQDNLGG